MTWEAHEHLIDVYRRLGDESLAERDFGESVKARENYDWKPTQACLLMKAKKPSKKPSLSTGKVGSGTRQTTVWKM